MVDDKGIMSNNHRGIHQLNGYGSQRTIKKVGSRSHPNRNYFGRLWDVNSWVQVLTKTHRISIWFFSKVANVQLDGNCPSLKVLQRISSTVWAKAYVVSDWTATDELIALNMFKRLTLPPNVGQALLQNVEAMKPHAVSKTIVILRLAMRQQNATIDLFHLILLDAELTFSSWVLLEKCSTRWSLKSSAHCWFRNHLQWYPSAGGLPGYPRKILCITIETSNN